MKWNSKILITSGFHLQYQSVMSLYAVIHYFKTIVTHDTGKKHDPTLICSKSIQILGSEIHCLYQYQIYKVSIHFIFVFYID